MRFAYVIAVVFCLSGYSWAQSGSTAGTITGTVKDQQGASVAGASVTVRHLETNAVRAVQTEDKGSYILVQMPPGKYEIAAQSEGFAIAKNEITLVLGVTILNDFTLVPDGSSEVVEVTAGNDPLAKTESSTNIARERIDNLPINRRDFLNFTLTTPRVVRDRSPGEGIISTSGLSFGGQSARFNNITIDGLDNNEGLTGSVRSTYSQEAVQEFQVVSDNYSAEFGRALGGVVNIVTRSGTNEYHGNLFLLNRNDETSARDVFSPFEPKYKQYQFGGTISGPVKKDGIFFFGSFERLSVKQSNFVTIGDESVQAARRRGGEDLRLTRNAKIGDRFGLQYGKEIGRYAVIGDKWILGHHL